MKRVPLLIGFSIILGSAAAAQPVPMSTPKPAPKPPEMAVAAPKPVAMAAAPKPAAAPSVMAPAKPADAMAAAMEVMKAPAPAAQPEMKAASATEKKDTTKQETPPWKSPAFWITVVGAPIVSIILGVLVAFGVIKKKWTEDERWKMIVSTVDKFLPSLNEWVRGTKNNIDDIIAQVITMLVARVGELTPEEKGKVEDLVKSRAHELDGAEEGPKEEAEEKPKDE